MLIIDGDYPMAYGAISLERDLTLPIGETREDPILPHRPLDWDTYRDGTMASIPEMRHSEMAVALVKIGDIFITVTGNKGVLRSEHFSEMKENHIIKKDTAIVKTSHRYEATAQNEHESINRSNGKDPDSYRVSAVPIKPI